MKRILFCMSLILVGPLAHAASFDCAKASTTIEKTICSDSRISDLDTQLTQSYKKSLLGSANVDLLKSEQRAWLAAVRNKCQDAGCLTQAYTERIAKLDGSIVPTITPPIKAAPEVGFSSQAKTNEAVPSSPTPVDVVEPPPVQPVAAPIPAPQQPKVEATAQAAPSKHSSPKVEDTSPSSPEPTPFKFPFTFSDVFRSLFAMGMLALMAGMIRPTLAARFIKEPSRKRIFLSSLVLLVPFALLSEITKTTEEKAQDLVVKQEREAERLAKQTEREQANRPIAQTSRSSRNSQREVIYTPPECNDFIRLAKQFKEEGLEDGVKSQMQLFKYGGCKPL